MKRLRFVLTFLSLFAIVIGLAACGSYDLEIQNKTDEVIDIYIDDFYEGSIAPNNYLQVRNLSVGEHYVEAFDLDSDRIMADDIYLDGDGRLIIYDSYFRIY